MSAPDACQRLANGIADALEMDGEGCPTETQTPREAIAEAFRRELPVIFGDLFADYARIAEAWKHAEAVRMTVDVAAQLLAAMIIARGPMSGPTMEVMVKRAVDAAQQLLAAFVTEGN